eukprot:777129-Pyramimonas_sp.AAC.1
MSYTHNGAPGPGAEARPQTWCPRPGPACGRPTIAPGILAAPEGLETPPRRPPGVSIDARCVSCRPRPLREGSL